MKKSLSSKKFLVVSVLGVCSLLLGVCLLIGCSSVRTDIGFIDNSIYNYITSDTPEEPVVSDGVLKVGGFYEVLDIREFAQSEKNYGGEYVFDGQRAIVIIVQDIDNKDKRTYLSTYTDVTTLDEKYKKLACLTVGDIFKYLGDYDYEIAKADELFYRDLDD